MPGLWRIRFEKVADLTGEEAEVITNYSEFVEDSAEMFLALEKIEDLQKQVRAEIFEALKEIEESGDTFMIA